MGESLGRKENSREEDKTFLEVMRTPETTGHASFKTPDRIKREEEDRNRLKEIEERVAHMNEVEVSEISDSREESKFEEVVVDGKTYIVEYVEKSVIAPAFGYAVFLAEGAGITGKTIIRNDLSLRVRNFVRAHELYHLRDKATWGGWIGREIRANIASGFRDPLGLLATIGASLSGERLNFYWKRIKGKY
ncbi:MAG: hypothetical protein A2847_00095 [Candidatus Sungbacteria bacterium RIFCSPHIGHO2_01_FULL_50_25]|uniref:Uncharacterized protein n=1 Tax=Candidatus Sungbacteria bacterium RIFCSPHIGHO2_01_FULL_50_25 TaxID=1802265 RepID=A0A1G2K988_9BACT|nr:MAG: hypothetical protein A2847_00095 [Candidatus Sungbacteria bacterium RIFCSPHIGHO2_01_FULL_50_25]